MTAEENSDRLKEIFNGLYTSGTVHTQRAFANLIGINEVSVSRAMRGDARYATDKFMDRVLKALEEENTEVKSIKDVDLKAFRKANGLSQQELATKLGLSRGFIAQVEDREQQPSVEEARQCPSINYPSVRVKALELSVGCHAASPDESVDDMLDRAGRFCEWMNR